MQGVAETPGGGGLDAHSRTLLAILRAVSNHRSRDQLFGAIAGVLREVLPCDHIAVVLDGPGPDDITPYFLLPRLNFPVLRKSHSALAHLFATGEEVYVRSRADVADRPGTIAVLERFGAHSYLALPLVVRGRIRAALVLHSKQPNAYDAVDRRLTAEVALVIAVALDYSLDYEELATAQARLEDDAAALRQELDEADGRVCAIVESDAMEEVRRLIKLVAPTDAIVLVTGETGTGKELAARAIHQNSSRARRPLIQVNCAAIPAGLVESELFGHEQGAFTDASKRRKGRFEMADSGTLFLDEIGELPLAAQPKLLRVLQSQELERVGGSDTIRVDVRVVAATNRDLRAMVAEGRFREDLYYRLNVFPLQLPPLRDRPDDIPVMAEEFALESARRLGRRPPKLDDDAIEALLVHPWPGNVRELQNLIERAVIVSTGARLEVEAVLPAAGGKHRD